MNKSAFAAALGILVAAVGLTAQTVHLSAEIPFSFRVGETVMSAGKYAVSTTDGVIRIRTAEGRHKSAFIVAQQQHSFTRKPAAMVFSRYGDEYFLSSVWGAWAQSGLRIQPSRLEKELSTRARFLTTTEIAAKAPGR